MFDWANQSPFVPLAKHMKQVRACVDLVRPMFECVKGQRYDELKQLAERVFKMEHEADEIKNQIRREIPTAFSLPVFRGDLLAYLHIQDDLADSVEDLAVLLTIKNLALPAVLEDSVHAYVEKVLDVCHRLYQAADELQNLAEADFRGPRVKQFLAQVASAEYAEWQADKLQYRLAQELFAQDDDMKPTDIYLWSLVFKELGRLANHADKTAERLRRMLAR